MTTTTPPFLRQTRRSLMLAAAAMIAAARARGADAAPLLLVAGPADGRLAPWARRCAAGFAAQPGGAGALPLSLDFTGGIDGVTAANQFDATAMPDGQMGLLLPGQAMLASLSADSRVRFVAARMAPVLLARTSCVLVVRPGVAVPRLVCSSPASPGTVALLALHLLGTRARPVAAAMPGPPDEDDGVQALESGSADAALLSGAAIEAQVARAARAGAGAIMRFGADPMGAAGSAPASLAALPRLADLLAARSAEPALRHACLAMSEAASLGFALALPALTPPAARAPWLAAAASLLADTHAQAQASAAGLALVAGDAAQAALTAQVLDAAEQLALHRFLNDAWLA